jgi:hypothetical protein
MRNRKRGGAAAVEGAGADAGDAADADDNDSDHEKAE